MFLVGKREEKRLLGGTCRRWEDDIKMDLKVTILEVLDWIHPDLCRINRRAFVNTAMNPWIL
jgi:hypothetical protein